MRRSCIGLLACLLAPLSALADVGPPPPQPPKPPGPDNAVIRGISISRSYGYWRGRRWLTSIRTCPEEHPACKDRRSAAGCFIMGVDGHKLPDGDVAALLEAVKSAENRPVSLQLENCRNLNAVELQP